VPLDVWGCSTTGARRGRLAVRLVIAPDAAEPALRRLTLRR